MICRMSFFNGDKSSAARIANLAVSDQLGLDGRPVVGRLDNACLEADGNIGRRRAQQFHMEIGGDGARS